MKQRIIIKKLRNIAISQVRDFMKEEDYYEFKSKAEEEMKRAKNIKSINGFLIWAQESSWDLPEAIGTIFHTMGINIEWDQLNPNNWDT